MATITITGVGSELHIKNREDEEYEDSYYFLEDIGEILVDGEEWDGEIKQIEVSDLLEHFGYKWGDTSIKWCRDEEADELFEFAFDFEVSDADHYDIQMQYVPYQKNAPKRLCLGYWFLAEKIIVNGEEYVTDSYPDYFGDIVEYDI